MGAAMDGGQWLMTILSGLQNQQWYEEGRGKTEEILGELTKNWGDLAGYYDKYLDKTTGTSLQGWQDLWSGARSNLDSGFNQYLYGTPPGQTGGPGSINVNDLMAALAAPTKAGMVANNPTSPTSSANATFLLQKLGSLPEEQRATAYQQLRDQGLIPKQGTPEFAQMMNAVGPAMKDLAPLMEKYGTSPVEQPTTAETVNPWFQGMTGRFEEGTKAFEDIKKTATENWDEILATLDTWGTTAATDIDKAFAGLSSRQKQDMVSRGLTGSTIAPTLEQGTERQRLREQGRLQEQVETGKRDVLATRDDVLRGIDTEMVTYQDKLAEQFGNALLQHAMFGTELDVNMGSNLLNEFTTAATNKMNMGLTFANQLTNMEMAKIPEYPPATNFFDMGLGLLQNWQAQNQYGQAQQAAKPGPWDYLAGPFGTAAGVTGGALAAGGIGSLFGSGGGGAMMMLPMMSDVTMKHNFRDIDPGEILEQVEKLDIARWKYKPCYEAEQSDHIGPMAQTFNRAFNVGPDPRRIEAVDAVGVLLASVKALAARVRELEKARA